MMKKRIISLLLVAVMSLLVLSGCAYNYSKDDMSKYADFDKTEFAKLLGQLKVTEGDFGTDETARQAKVLDAIFTDLAKSADTDDKIKTGKAGKYDILYYCYYATAVIGEEECRFFVSNLAESSATKIQLGLSTLEGYKKEIAEAFAALENIEGNIYKTWTTNPTTVAKNDVVYVSYTKEYTEGDQVKKYVSNYEKVTLTDDKEANTFLGKLVDKTIGASSISFDITTGEGESAVTDKYTGVKIHCRVESDVELGTGFKDVTYKSDDEKGKEVKDSHDVKRDLRGVELTYHVFPVYRLAVQSELTADVILNEFYSSLMATENDEDGNTKYMLELVEKNEYAKDDVKIRDLLTELSNLQSELSSLETKTSDAQKKVDSAQSEIDKAGGKDKATETQKANLATAETALQTAKDNEKEAKDKVDAQIAKIKGVGGNFETDLVKDYKAYRYKVLENAYKKDLKNALAKEIYAAAEKLIVYKKGDNGQLILPKKAVRDAYKRLENNYKYEFHEGKYDDGDSSTTDTKTNYEFYKGNYDQYLRLSALGLKENATDQQVKDAIGVKAEAHVKEVILVYTLAEIYGDAVKVTDEDIDGFKQSWQYWLLSYQVGENNVNENDFIYALQLDNILNYLLEEKDAEGNAVVYERVSYTFKED